MAKTVEVLGLKVFSDTLDQIDLNKKHQSLNTISPNSYGLTTKDTEFLQALKDSDILVLDGVYFALASLVLKGKNIKKNQAPEVFDFYMNLMNEKKGRIFFLGSSEGTLEKIRKRAKEEYSNVSIGTFSPPFKAVFSDEDNEVMINTVNEFKPDILFVGMTAPKQEKWIVKHINRLDVSVACGIGGVFDWFAGNYPPLHPIWWKLRLGWLGRIIQRPEIIKRNGHNIMIFVQDTIKVFLGIKKVK